jgi:hypothetical protein
MVAVVLGGLLALVSAACGDDDDGGLGSGTGITEGEAATTAGDDAADDTAADDTATDDTAGGEEPTGGDLVRWCEITADLDDNDPFDELADDAPADQVEAAFDELDERLDGYVDSSPDQIRDDVETLTGAYEQVREVLASHDYDITEAITDPELEEVLTNTEVEDAGTRVDEFEDANCS